MTDEEHTLQAIQAVIAQMSQADQEKIEVEAVKLRAAFNSNGHTAMAFALVGAELAAKP